MSVSSRQTDFSSPTRYCVRAVQPSDLYEIAGVLVDSFPLYPSFLPWLAPVIRVGIHEDLRSRTRFPVPNYVCLVAIDTSDRAERLVGTVEIGLRGTNPWQPRTNQYIYLSNLAVREDARRQGVAQQLLLACEPYVQEWGYRNIYLHVLETNEAAKRLYFKLGYQLEEIQPSWDWFLGKPRRMFLRKELRSPEVREL
ncbi:GNAT family N-acetyltransferase [Leptolyngbya sp. FACHB-17]|uniref:GNAT family N-acetyltransferase n=1 Tax=unclassified Leptolyngbya TaxID=2650499 RepID=UPI00167FE7B6|nr:GNAT family N-acetyltransferase [Leptolyngbya sp. FACHB-17]